MRHQDGFTLLEGIIIVIAVLILLALFFAFSVL